MQKKRRKARGQHDTDFVVSDGSMGNRDYGTEDYTDFLSNGRTNNEKVEAQEYFETFLNE